MISGRKSTIPSVEVGFCSSYWKASFGAGIPPRPEGRGFLPPVQGEMSDLRSVLWMASSTGNLELLSMVLDSVEFSAGDIDQAVVEAVDAGKMESLSLLIPRLSGRDVPMTAISVAAVNGWSQGLERLLALPRAKDDLTELLASASASGNRDCVRLLLPFSDSKKALALSRYGEGVLLESVLQEGALSEKHVVSGSGAKRHLSV